MDELALFAGAGGGILGGGLVGFRTIAAVEINPYRREVLLRRQEEKILPAFPIWGDIRTFDPSTFAGAVDVVTAGFPCQDISCAGSGLGIGGPKSKLWSEVVRVVRAVGPRFVFVENSPMLTSRGLGRVLGDLADLGFDAEWGVFSAAASGAWHRRRRLFLLAHSLGVGCIQRRPRCEGIEGRHEIANGHSPVPDSHQKGQLQPKRGVREEWGRLVDGPLEDADVVQARCEEWEVGAEDGGKTSSASVRTSWWDAEPRVGRVVDGIPYRVQRVEALGDSQVPAVVARAWETLRGRF